MYKFLVYAAICCVAACSQAPKVMAKKGAPVQISNASPTFDSSSNTWRTVVHVQARTALETVRVELSGYRNATLVGGDRSMQITDVASGEIHDVPLVIELGEVSGYVSVIVMTTDYSGATRQRTAALRIGSDEQGSVRSELAKPSSGTNGESLILMPAQTN